MFRSVTASRHLAFGEETREILNESVNEGEEAHRFMVDTLRSGTKAAETMIGGMGGGVTYSVIQDGLTLDTELIQIFILAVVLMGLFISLHWYYERRSNEEYLSPETNYSI